MKAEGLRDGQQCRQSREAGDLGKEKTQDQPGLIPHRRDTQAQSSGEPCGGRIRKEAKAYPDRTAQESCRLSWRVGVLEK